MQAAQGGNRDSGFGDILKASGCGPGQLAIGDPI